MNNEYGNYAKHPNFYLETDDVWGIIWRKGDYNLPHRHPGYHIAGAFYFKIPPNEPYKGGLALSNPSKNNYPIYDNNNANGLKIENLEPKAGWGSRRASLSRTVQACSR